MPARPVVVLAAVVLVVTGLILALALTRGTAPPEPSAAPPPAEQSEEPDTAAQLLAASEDPQACAVTFAGEAVEERPMLVSADEPYPELPIPVRDGRVFAGWYTSAEAAGTLATRERVNIADAARCDERRRPLHGAWRTPAEVARADVGVPVLMYHLFTERPEGIEGPLQRLATDIDDFDAQMGHLADRGFYHPSWRELSAFIDGDLQLPERSVVVTDDDVHPSWSDLAIPVLERHGILATSFVITGSGREQTPSQLVLQRSHTHDMHTRADDGRGRMLSWSSEQIISDLETSTDLLHAKEVVAYPFGHYDDAALQAVRAAGFELGLTTETGRVHAGSDKLTLPRIAIDYGLPLEDFIDLVG